MVDEEARQTLAASNQGESMTDDSWYWCFAHNAAEHAGSSCPPEKRIGPYESRAAAEHWQDRVDDRNRAWDAADE